MLEKKILKPKPSPGIVVGYCYLSLDCTGPKAVDIPIPFEECQEVGLSWQDPDGYCHLT
jgi:hypothetical protein